MATLLNAAKYLAADRGFAPVYTDDPVFGEPIIPAAHAETFAALHLLVCTALGIDPAYISAERVTNWLSSKAMSANV